MSSQDGDPMFLSTASSIGSCYQPNVLLCEKGLPVRRLLGRQRKQKNHWVVGYWTADEARLHCRVEEQE
jgi:hypothetical protein